MFVVAASFVLLILEAVVAGRRMQPVHQPSVVAVAAAFRWLERAVVIVQPPGTVVPRK